MSGCSHRPLAISGPPWTTFSTPGGRPASSASSARNSDEVGSCSDGLSTKVLPQDGDGEHEAGQHHREVERGDAGAHAQRLNQRVDVDAGGGVLGIFAQLQVGDRAGVLDHFQAAADFALGVGQGLAVLARDHLGQLGGVGAQQVLELQHDAHARALPGVAPGLERFLGIGHRQVQFLARGEGHLGDHFLRGRIDHVPPFSGLGLHELAADH